MRGVGCEGRCGCRLATIDGFIHEVTDEPPGVGSVHTLDRCRVIRVMRQTVEAAVGDSEVHEGGLGVLIVRGNRGSRFVDSAYDLAELLAASASRLDATARECAGNIRDVLDGVLDIRGRDDGVTRPTGLLATDPMGVR